MIPSVSRNVHYVSEHTSACQAAIITGAWPPGSFAPGSSEGHRSTEVSLFVMHPDGLSFPRNVPLDEGSDQAPVPATGFDTVPEPLCGGKWHAGRTWHWPARVPE